MNLLASFEKETRESASNSSGFCGKFERGGAGEWSGDSMLAMIARTHWLLVSRMLESQALDIVETRKVHITY